MPYVHIDSSFLDDPNNNSIDTKNNFTYPLSRPINNVELIVLKHARFKTPPTVIAGINDKVYFYAASDGGGATMLVSTLDEGYYTADELVAEMNTKMTATATSANFNSTYDANTNKFTLIADENVRFPTEQLVTNSFLQDQGEIFSEFSLLVGNNDKTLLSASTSTEMAYEMDLQPLKYITIVIELNGFKNTEVIGNKYSYSFVVPNPESNLQGNILYRENTDFLQKNFINHINVNKVNVKTYFNNQLQRPINFLEGKNFELMFEFIQSNKYAYIGRSGR